MRKPRRYVFYFYRDGEQVGTVVVYGNPEDFVSAFTRSGWRLFDKVDNKYFFVPEVDE